MNAPIPDVGRNASPYLHGPEYEAACRILRTGHYGHTEVTERFEREVADFLGVPDAVAVASGTAALHLALLAAGIGPGDEVIVPSMTFCATVQAILATGAHPRFADVDPTTLCTTGRDVLAALTPAARAVMPVLYGGRAVDLGEISATLAARGIVVVEDAAQAFGSYDGAVRVGAAGRLTCFSFGPIKALTCTQGGMIIPRGPQDATAARSLRMLGIAQSAAERAAATSYAVTGFGTRAQLPALNAAIGSVQLADFAASETRRKHLWSAYRDALRDVEGVTVVDIDVEHSVPTMCVVRTPHRDQVFEALQRSGIAVGVHYPANHLQPAFAAWHRSLPVTEAVAREVLSLPFHPHLTENDAADVARRLRRALAAAGQS